MLKPSYWPVLTTSFFLASGFITPLSAKTPEPIHQYNLSLKLAEHLADHTITACHAQQKNIAVAVLDRGGNILVFKRHESVGPHNALAAQRKAYTALSTKTRTSVLNRNAQNNPEASNLNTLNELLLLGGGIPVTYKNEVIGAVGVAGGGGAAQDEACAEQGVQKSLSQE